MGKTGLHRKVFQSHKMVYLSKYKSHRIALFNSMKESNLAPISNDHQRWSGSSVDGCKIIETAIIWIRSRAQWAGWWSYDELAGSAMVPLSQMQRIFYGIRPFLWDSDNLWINPLSAKPSFQLWYPGGQRLKVISFSWSWVKSPSKCFSNTEPTTIIASRDEKRCNAPVQRRRLVHSSSLRLSDQYRKCHGWLLFFAFPALQPDRPAAVHLRPRKERSAKR